jgi:prepilin-type N-terminal cleavage/methylation domain-containing protein
MAVTMNRDRSARRRPGLTLVELIIVLAIIAAMIGLLLPAVQAAREKAREAVCKNHLHQLSLALAQFQQTAKQLPIPPAPGKTGGWTVEILPFLEQRSLHDQLGANIPLSAIPQSALPRPPVMRCPVSRIVGSNAPPIQASHFVLAPTPRRDSWWLLDAPEGFQQPWIVGPEMNYDALTTQPGPHHRGFHISGSDGAVRLLIDGRTVQ